MKVGVLVALLLLAPPLAGAKDLPTLEHPEPLRALVPGWLDAADAEGRDAQDRPVSPAAQHYLDLARAAAAQGRVRVVLFDLDTHLQLVSAHRLAEEARQQGSSLTRQKEFILARDVTLRDAAMDDWTQYRARLHGLDGQLRSLHATELALASADLALAAIVQTKEGDDLRLAFLHAEGLDETLVAALARTSVGVSRALSQATDVLDAAAGLEGLPPRLVDARWNDTVAAARLAPAGGAAAPFASLEAVAGDARSRGEDLLAVALHLAELRLERLVSIVQQYGDAGTRGQDILGDATRGLRRGIENVSVDAPRKAGLQGASTALALDHATYALQLAEEGYADLGTLAQAWAMLDHATRVTEVLAYAAGREPTPEPVGHDTPGPALALLLAAAGAAALALAPFRPSKR